MLTQFFNKRVFGVGICLICLTNQLGAKDLSADEQQWNTFKVELEGLRTAHLLPGLAVAVVQNNQLAWSQGFGFAESNNRVRVTPDTPFWIASITKSFVGLTYLHLEQQGKVNLDELAADTPGFTDLCEWLAGTIIPFAKGLNCNAPITIRHILHHQVNDKPGTKFLYNPIMYSRLSRHLENRFGKNIDGVKGQHNQLGQAIDKYILEPAGMTRTMSSMWDRSKPLVYFDMAAGFNVDEKRHKSKLPAPDRYIAGGAGVVSTVLDLAKFDMAISSGKIASGEIAKKLLQPAKFNDGSASPYGFGWYFQCYRGEKLMWHSGWEPDNGYSAIHLRLPERGLAFIALANGEGLWWGNPLDKALIQNSDFAKLFMQYFVFSQSNLAEGDCL